MADCETFGSGGMRVTVQKSDVTPAQKGGFWKGPVPEKCTALIRVGAEIHYDATTLSRAITAAINTKFGRIYDVVEGVIRVSCGAAPEEGKASAAYEDILTICEAQQRLCEEELGKAPGSAPPRNGPTSQAAAYLEEQRRQRGVVMDPPNNDRGL